jgi:hypothetical protein
MASRKHTHMYRADLVNSVRQWSCDLPDCGHFIPRNIKPPVGKMSLCNNCFSPFMLTPENMKDDKPTCDSCKTNVPLGMDIVDAIERNEVRAKLAKKHNKQPDEITEDEITRYMSMYGI